MKTKTFETTIARASGASRKIDFTLSTHGVDRDGDSIKGPWILTNYRKNPVVLFAHDYKSLPVARCTSISSASGALIATAEFADADLSPVADQVFRMLTAGFLKAVSVGFKPIDTPTLAPDGQGLIYGACELLEFSVVPVPSNGDALRRSVAGAISASIADGRAIVNRDISGPEARSIIIAALDRAEALVKTGDLSDEKIILAMVAQVDLT